ncbi:MAG: archaemetzincin family Zn-dependent metalloprotease [Candidatus Hadarchaeales archaeon]
MLLRLFPVGDVKVEINRLGNLLIGRFTHFSKLKVEKPLNIPESAYVAERRQHDAGSILDLLSGISRPGEKILGITGVDLCVRGSNLNFVFGLAHCPGRAAVVSVFRLNPELYGQKNGDLFFERVVKECVHELGHTFGLGHCRFPLCVMNFSNSIIDVDRKRDDFCESCRRFLSAGEGI